MSEGASDRPNELMSYQIANEIKESFTDVYNARTPHAYFAEMGRLGYEIGERAKPYFQQAIRWMRERPEAESDVQVLDLGCSYGIGSALVKFDFTFDELAGFFARRAPRDYGACVDATRSKLADTRPAHRVRCIGADASQEAIRFARDARLLDGGLNRNLEEEPSLDGREVALVRRSNLLISTGAIGYVGPRTLSTLLAELGKDSPLERGPCAVITILRMFDPAPVTRTFERFGFRLERVSEVCLPQRRFGNDEELQQTLDLLDARGVNADGWESTGRLYADLFAATRPGELRAFIRKLEATRDELAGEESEDLNA